MPSLLFLFSISIVFCSIFLFSVLPIFSSPYSVFLSIFLWVSFLVFQNPTLPLSAFTSPFLYSFHYFTVLFIIYCTFLLQVIFQPLVCLFFSYNTLVRSSAASLWMRRSFSGSGICEKQSCGCPGKLPCSGRSLGILVSSTQSLNLSLRDPWCIATILEHAKLCSFTDL